MKLTVSYFEYLHKTEYGIMNPKFLSKTFNSISPKFFVGVLKSGPASGRRTRIDGRSVKYLPKVALFDGYAKSRVATIHRSK